MKRIYEINLIMLCVFVLFVNDNSAVEGSRKNNYIRSFIMLKEVKNLRHGILPGTRWCGRGNIARNNSELGTYNELDACCRAHDSCEDYIRPKSEKYGLYNKYICRSSLCECEVQFYNCLAQISGLYSSIVGQVYFRKCKKCFRTYYDITECEREGLDVIEENDRNGRRVFCAKFDRNPKWRRGRNITLPTSTSIPELLITNDDESVLLASQSSSDSASKYFNDDDDIVYENFTPIEGDD
ncbi:hypothetical protein DMN91_007504 [Ooceraea biroi]|uniref:phospholipase A2 n=1 Tax=Ooceraea biroi TaxID=2015173 RepID=A0A026X338_OOCBI|nr:uncharacterized protein LOC105287629 [Ooceraea biroi]EZA62662.1 Phospholipase A2 [Ooceraea biroi]RLU20890.1 hypothetical protein DMN91_007504 [Ooceraea biroi]